MALQEGRQSQPLAPSPSPPPSLSQGEVFQEDNVHPSHTNGVSQQKVAHGFCPRWETPCATAEMLVGLCSTAVALCPNSLKMTVTPKVSPPARPWVSLPCPPCTSCAAESTEKPQTAAAEPARGVVRSRELWHSPSPPGDTHGSCGTRCPCLGTPTAAMLTAAPPGQGQKSLLAEDSQWKESEGNSSSICIPSSPVLLNFTFKCVP